MKKVFLFTLCIFLFVYSNAFAIDYNDIQLGMSYDEVLSSLSDFEIEETVRNNSTSIEAENNDVKIRVSLSEKIVSSFRFTKYGEDKNKVDYSVADWSLMLEDVIDELEEKEIGYEYRTRERNFSGFSRENLGIVHTLEFHGYMDYIPVEYFLTFGQDRMLSEIEISESDNKKEGGISNYLVILSFLGEELGIPEKSEIGRAQDYSIDDGSCYKSDTCYWELHHSKYEMRIETCLEETSSDDESYNASLYNYFVLCISPIEE